MQQRRLLKLLVGIVLMGGILMTGSYAYMHSAKFGAFPSGARLLKVEASPNYSNGEFQNLEPIPSMTTEKKSVVQGLMAFLLSKKDRPRPEAPVPSVKTDLKALNRKDDVVVWLGHSSFYIQLAVHRILVDPVFSDNAAPIPFVNRAFLGSNVYSAADMPEIDILLITHDHWDHLDYPTVMALKSITTKVVCPLGVGAHLERWAFPANAIVELDWNEVFSPDGTLAIHALPARHYSGRTLTRNKTLWAAYALISPAYKMYLSGDTGYGTHFQNAGKTFGGFDLAVLDSGQYNEDWRYVHMMPEDAAQAATELRAKALLPAHVGKFSIARHAWDEPFNRIEKANANNLHPLLTPKIGEPFHLGTAQHSFSPWWKE